MKTANGGGKPAPEQYKITSLIFAAILFIVTLGVGVLFGYEYLIFQSPPQATESTCVAAEDGAGNPLDRDKIYPMQSRLIFNRAYASSSDIQSVTLRANVLPEDTDNKSVDWSISFVNDSSAWAQGKNVSDYITVTPVSDDNLTVTISCLNAFAEQIAINVVSTKNPLAKATCLVDYRQKLLGVLMEIKNGTMPDGIRLYYPTKYSSEPKTETQAFKVNPDYVGAWGLNVNCEYSEVFTLSCEKQAIDRVLFQANGEFISEFSQFGFSDQADSYFNMEFNPTDKELPPLLNKPWFLSVFPQYNVRKEQIINAMKNFGMPVYRVYFPLLDATDFDTAEPCFYLTIDPTLLYLM